MTARDEWLDRFRSLKQYSRGGQRAPHKPLLVLLALGDVIRGCDRQHSFPDIDERLRVLLARFGPPTRPSPEYPFVRLAHDGVWETPGIEGYRTRVGHTDPPRSALLEGPVKGSFPSDLHDLLAGDSALIHEIAGDLLERNFPESMHSEILDAVGLGGLLLKRRARDAKFRPNVMLAYQNRCAVCGLDSTLDGEPYLLDAAHIRWHNMAGPDEVTNGLALCAVHHRALDRGAIGVDREYRVLVSARAVGGERNREALIDFHGKQLAEPYNPDFLPKLEHLEWHLAQVFRDPGRPM